MPIGQTITLYLTRNDGKRERAELRDRTLTQAKHTVKGLFRFAPGLYIKAEIRRAGKLMETITSKLAVRAKQLSKN